jgi:GT2 family glycosyltransferase
MHITASIVTYRNDFNILKKTIESFLNTKFNIKLYIIDNSPSNEIINLCDDNRIEYVFNNANIGFGAGHNMILKYPTKMGCYHIVINPDVYFNFGVLEELYDYMEAHQDVGLIMPDVYFPDGKRQFLPKLLPYVSDLIFRRFNISERYRRKINYKYEMQFVDYDKPFEIAIASGCFSFFRKDAIVKTNILYDDNFFMYFEDLDISRRIAKYYKIVCNPKVHITHEYGRGSHKNRKLFFIFIRSLVKYFNKWGWFYDKQRKNINNKLIKMYLIKK